MSRLKICRWFDVNLDGMGIGTLQIRLPAGERILGFLEVERGKFLVKSSNGWYWNIYYDVGRGKFKLQKLK